MTETTTEKPSVIEAITAIKAEVGAVGKAGFNQQQGYNFRGVDAVVNAISGALIRNGVVVAPVATVPNHGTVEVGKNRTPMGHCTVAVTYRFHGPNGDYIDVQVPGEAMDSGDKATPKAMSVAYRTALLQTLTLPTDEVDPDAQSYERSATAAEPVTDAEWLTRMESDISAAPSVQELETIANTIRAADQAGQVSKVHGQHLFHLYQQRQGELAGQGTS